MDTRTQWNGPSPAGQPPAGQASPRHARSRRRWLAALAAVVVVAAAGAYGIDHAVAGGAPRNAAQNPSAPVTFTVPGSSQSNTYTISGVSVVRDGTFARLEATLGCLEQSGCPAGSDLEGSGSTDGFSGVSLVDTDDATLLLPVEDGNGNPSTSALPGTLDAGVAQPVWTTFPALAPTVTRVAVSIAGGPTIVDVPVTSLSSPWQPSALAATFSQPPTDHDTAGLRIKRFPMTASTTPARGQTPPAAANPATVGGYRIAAGPLIRQGRFAVLELTVTCLSGDSSGSSGSCEIGSDFALQNDNDVIDDFGVRAGNVNLGGVSAGGDYVTSSVPGSIDTGASVSTWMWYAAPPAGTTSVTVIVPNGPAIGDVPVR